MTRFSQILFLMLIVVLTFATTNCAKSKSSDEYVLQDGASSTIGLPIGPVSGTGTASTITTGTGSTSGTGTGSTSGTGTGTDWNGYIPIGLELLFIESQHNPIDTTIPAGTDNAIIMQVDIISGAVAPTMLIAVCDVVITVSGTGDPSNLGMMKIWFDENNDGLIEPSADEYIIAEGSVDPFTQRTSYWFPQMIPILYYPEVAHWQFNVDIGPNAASGDTYTFEIQADTDVTAKDVFSDMSARSLNLPQIGATITVQ
ncbi:MAG: hypothetical protein ACYS8W_16465 [Planctomycetota bacterium]